MRCEETKCPHPQMPTILSPTSFNQVGCTRWRQASGHVSQHSAKIWHLCCHRLETGHEKKKTWGLASWGSGVGTHCEFSELSISTCWGTHPETQIFFPENMYQDLGEKTAGGGCWRAHECWRSTWASMDSGIWRFCLRSDLGGVADDLFDVMN